MPHQCVNCSRIIPMASKELLDGCKECGGHFFFFIKDEQLAKIRETPLEIPEDQKGKIEQDVRDIAGIVEYDAPVILDLESIRITGEGKFELDIVNLFRKDRPLIYKLEEGKYIIDLATTLRQSVEFLNKVKEQEKKFEGKE